MNRLTAIVLVLFAALSLLVYGTRSAQASAPEFHAEKAPALFEAEQVVKHVFTYNGATVSCKRAAFVGTSTITTSATIEFTPTYDECTWNGRGVTMDTNGCKLLLHLAAGSSPPTATVDVEGCNASAPHILVTIPALPCTETVPEQTGIKHVTFKSEGSGVTRDLLATVSVANIKYTELGAGCLGSNVGTQQSNGTYTGTATLKGYLDSGGTKGAQQGIWVE